jgi:hypothetical protein
MFTQDWSVLSDTVKQSLSHHSNADYAQYNEFSTCNYELTINFPQPGRQLGLNRAANGDDPPKRVMLGDQRVDPRR